MNEKHTRIEVIIDGELITHDVAADTVYDVIIRLIKKFGGDRVVEADKNPYSHQQRLISTSPLSPPFRYHTRYQQWYISRDWRTERKQKLLEDIAECLSQPITVKNCTATGNLDYSLI